MYKKFFGEFKEFIMRGNVLDLAVGVIIGGAFKTIVDSLTADIISPILGLFGGIDFSDLAVGNIRYGSFITSVINFLIMALIIFVMVKIVNKVMSLSSVLSKNTDDVPTTKICPYCKSEIDITASKCPHCTSDLIDVPVKELL